MTDGTDKLRASNDALAKKLGIDPAQARVEAAEREALRLVRLLPRAPDPGLRARLEEAAHKLLDAEAAFERSRVVVDRPQWSRASTPDGSGTR